MASAIYCCDGGPDLPDRRHVRSADYDLAIGTDSQRRVAWRFDPICCAGFRKSDAALELEIIHARRSHRGKMMTRSARIFERCAGQARRHRRDPFRDAVACAQRSPRRTRAAANGSTALSHRGADAAQPRGSFRFAPPGASNAISAAWGRSLRHFSRRASWSTARSRG